MLEDDGVGPAAPQDEGGGEVGGVAERPLALDHDHVGILALEGLDRLALALGVEGDFGEVRQQNPWTAGAVRSAASPCRVTTKGLV